jgi:hypothetical protein
MFVVAVEVYEREEADQDVVKSCTNPRMCSYWAQLDT